MHYWKNTYKDLARMPFVTCNCRGLS